MTPRQTRRRVLQLGTLAAFPVGGATGSQPQLSNHFLIVGDGGVTYYTLEVSGQLQKTDTSGPAPFDGPVTINDSDTVSGGRVEGRTTNEADAYRYSGEITTLETRGAFTAYDNGNPISSVNGDNGQDSPLPKHFLIVGDGGVAYYTLEVSGDIEKTSSAGPAPFDGPVTINQFDTVSGGRAEGRTTNEADAYRYSGTIERFETRGAFTAYDNGQPYDGRSVEDIDADVENYRAVVDGTSYDRVVIRTVDGTVLEFTGDFSGEQSFGYPPAPDSDRDLTREIDGFYGQITDITVFDGSASKTFESSGLADFGISSLEFGCSAVRADGTYAESTLALVFADGSVKQYFDNEVTGRNGYTLGSPGRRVVRAEFFGVSIDNPNSNCRPTTARETTFDGDSFTIEPRELQYLPEPEFAMVELTFVDGTTQEFGDITRDGFSAPATFEGTGQNAGKQIQSVTLTTSLVSGFTYVNPAVDSS